MHGLAVETYAGLLPAPVARRREARVAVVEDHPAAREGLEQLLGHTPGLELAASFASAERALAVLEAAHGAAPWDLVLVDLRLPGLSGVECVRRLKRLAPGLRVVVLSLRADASAVLAAVAAGADGYLVKDQSARELQAQLRAAVAGGVALAPQAARVLLERVRRQATADEPDEGGPRPALTARERDVLHALADGCGYEEAARRLALRLDTVRAHVRSLYRKLAVHSAAQAVARALRERLI